MYAKHASHSPASTHNPLHTKPSPPRTQLFCYQLRVSLLHLCLCCILKVMQSLVKQASGSGGLSSLMSAALQRQTVSATAIWQLLLAVPKTETCPLNLLLEEVGKEAGAGAFFRAGEQSSFALVVPYRDNSRPLGSKRTLLCFPPASLPSGATANKFLCSPPQRVDCG